ncbi:MAG TPA: S9 family peptidase [Allosphingosinicella sp.]|jgi:dipeptidyl aminopeptidase/acylaminoacyl peptidase
MARTMLELAAAALLAALASGSASPQSEAGPPPPIPAEAFGALPFFTAPEISPDGSRLVAGSVSDGRKAVVLADLTRPDYALARIDLSDKFEMLWARWAGNRRVLMSLVIPTTLYGTEIRTSRLFLFEVDTGKVHPLDGKIGGVDGDDVIHADPAGDYILLSAQRSIFETPAVLHVDLNTRKARQLVKPYPGVWSWYADRDGTVRAGLGTENGRWWLFYRESGQAGFKKVGTGRRPENESLTDVEKLLPVAGSDKGYAIANKSTGRYGVYRYDFVTDALGEPVFEHPEVDVDGVGFSPRTGDPDSVSYADDRDRVAWLDPAMKSVQARLDRLLPGAVNRIVSRDASDRRMVVWSGGASDPGTYYIFDRAKGELRELARPYAALDGKPLAPVRPVRYRARDGLQVPAYLTLPLGRPARGLPLIVMPHGGPFIRDKWAYEPWAQFLANRGYAVLQPNFRGSTGYGKAFVEAASGQFGRKMQDDLDDGVRWLAGQGIVDSGKVCIMGASYGGYAAMWAAVRNPDIYRCAISYAGISDVGEMLRFDRSQWIAQRYYRDWRDRIRGDGGFDLAKVSPISRASEIRIPLLIAHGRKDGNVPFAQSKKLHEALLRAKVPHDFVIYPDEGHGFSRVENSVDFLKRVERFLGRHNPAA